jgi:hypothetical protein
MQIYNTKNRQPQQITYIGELYGDVTLLALSTEFDTWNGKKWVTDTVAQHAAATKTAQQKLSSFKNSAVSRINELTYAVNLNIATDAEKAALTEWQKYAVLLSRIDMNAATIDWPDQPSS